MNKILKSVLIFTSLVSVSFGQASTIRASAPTHLFYTPTPYVNSPFDLVIGFHEISFALPAHLQIQLSLFDNIGRVNFGVKYGLIPDRLAIGGGMAWNFIHLGRGSHGIRTDADPRIGMFLTYGLVGSKNSTFQLNGTPHFQFSDHFSIGADLGLLASPHPVWSIIWELGTSADLSDGIFYMNTDAGIRIHPPKAKFLTFDFGIDLTEFALGKHFDSHKPHVSPYIDFIFAMKTK